VIRLAGISVFLEGNVIDLGVYKLQVAEACNGLRYLFPLMTLAFIVAYFFRAPLWQRFVLFLASIPIAILMNSLRIALIGVTVEYWGVKMAEGVLHDFEGWVVFMASLLVLLGTALLLTRLRGVKGGLRDVLVFDGGAPAPPAKATKLVQRHLPRPFVVAAALGATCAIMGFAMPERSEAQPTRADFTSFPTDVDGWHGRRTTMEKVYLDALQLDDYLLADYARASTRVPVNLYVAWYDSQRNGRAAHSPRACLPGGGWVIKSLDQRVLTVDGKPLRANRAVIELGRERQVVYYWFQQRGRDITNEYLAKWYIFWDALTRNRTDGALVRLAAPVPAGMDEARADSIVAQFAAAALPSLKSYIPE
jgi:exosortase D (VPLPA-CTERM-specific)